ncbi:MAG: glycosyltransferase family 4 protein, partial [Flavobacteriales bacterium]
EAAGLKNNVVLTGWIDRTDMASFYGLLDIYLHAAVLEPFGLVYPEAMMNAVPVVSTSTGAAADAIKDGENGILVSERTPKALADGVERLLRSDHGSIGIAGKKTALEMYSFDVMWQGTVDLYRNALNSIE